MLLSIKISNTIRKALIVYDVYKAISKDGKWTISVVVDVCNTNHSRYLLLHLCCIFKCLYRYNIIINNNVLYNFSAIRLSFAPKLEYQSYNILLGQYILQLIIYLAVTLWATSSGECHWSDWIAYNFLK